MMDYDARLASVGELGTWHWLVLLLLIPAALLPGMWSVLFVFSGFVVKHRQAWHTILNGIHTFFWYCKETQQGCEGAVILC